MKTRMLTLCAAALALAAMPAAADHNSQDGMGSANMPNDIHNVRLDVRLSDADNSYFTDFVQYGEGADVPNRCLSEDPEDCVVYDVP
jgi:ABC-type sugar transport system substrate-binding protein